jgi:UDP-GlcNAc:undecaprenyl-phosphate GlcNAc-1-phosphate transferase
MIHLEDLLIFVFAGFVVCLGVNSWILSAFARRRFALRSAEFHHNMDQMPIPRFGGVGLAAAFVLVICLPMNPLWELQADSMRWVIAGLALAMFGLGFWDDLRALGAKRKLLGQLAISSSAYFLGIGIHQFKIPMSEHIIDLGIFGLPVTVFWLVAMTNLINLIDGVDGLAGGISLMLMILLSAVSGETGMPFVSVGMAGALLAFLLFNAPPARIYLGDGGAYFLGFLIGCLTIYNSHKGTVVAALIAPLFVMVLPILDTSMALLRRGMNGLPLFRPDRQHLHHQLLQSGVSRENLALGAYIFTGFFLVLGLVAFWMRGQGLALLVGGVVLALMLMASRFGFCREWFNVRATLGKTQRNRAEIHYALTLTNWLALEGERGRDLQSICEDAAFIARKLGFATIRIRLDDGERVWELIPCLAEGKCADDCRCEQFRHGLPGNPACWIELQTPKLDEQAELPDGVLAKFEIVGEILAEGWAKALKGWCQRHQSPMRFNPEKAPLPSSSATATPLA